MWPFGLRTPAFCGECVGVSMGNDLYETLLYLCSGGQAWDAKLPASAQPDPVPLAPSGAEDGDATAACYDLLFCMVGRLHRVVQVLKLICHFAFEHTALVLHAGTMLEVCTRLLC